MGPDNENFKKCSFCDEDIPLDAGRCPYCGSLLDTKVDEGNIVIMPEEESNKIIKPHEPEYGIDRQGRDVKNTLSNGMKVFLTVLFTIVPGLGQLAGIITSIVFMNTDEDPDKKSFGVALLVASLIMFVLSCIACFILVLVVSMKQTF